MQNKIDNLLQVASSIFLGKEKAIKLSLVAILSNAHVLIEDGPGLGKTTLVHLLAKLIGLKLSRIQLTSDLLPSDILGNLIYNQQQQCFETYRGPIFANFILADELNRGNPKTQSAFLQAMEEGTVTIDKEVLQLPSPFMVFATQNPKDLAGTFPLPESQLDRFLLRFSIGYPDSKYERELLIGPKRKIIIDQLTPILDVTELVRMQTEVTSLMVSDELLNYVQKILAASRDGHLQQKHPEQRIHGLSPRGGQAIIEAAKAWAYIHHRKYVLPIDIQEIIVETTSHRIIPEIFDGENIIKDFIKSIPV